MLLPPCAANRQLSSISHHHWASCTRFGIRRSPLKFSLNCHTARTIQRRLARTFLYPKLQAERPLTTWPSSNIRSERHRFHFWTATTPMCIGSGIYGHHMAFWPGSLGVQPQRHLRVVWSISWRETTIHPIKTTKNPTTSIQFFFPGKIDERMVYWGTKKTQQTYWK